jgi:hypothetical protein
MTTATAEKRGTLYVCRPVQNAKAIDDWARAQGIRQRTALADLHVTIAYSRSPLLWPQPDKGVITIPSQPVAGGGAMREVKPLGDEGAVVLAFDSSELYRRWRYFLERGARWDYATFAPHITLTYNAGAMVRPLAGVKPYTGPIELGPEKFATVDDDWAAKRDKA